MTVFSQNHEAPALEAIDNRNISIILGPGIFEAIGKDTYISFPGFWEVERFHRCILLLGIFGKFWFLFLKSW